MEYVYLTRSHAAWRDIEVTLRRHVPALVGPSEHQRVTSMLAQWVDAIDPATPFDEDLTIHVSMQTALTIWRAMSADEAVLALS